MHTNTSMSPAEIVRAEYGDSTNMMAPHVLTVGGESGRWACEVAHGDGITPGTFVVGCSVVVVVPGGTERAFDLSRSFHGDEINTLIDQALDYMRGLGERVEEYLDHRRKLDAARQLGHENGVAAGSWVIDANTSEETARRILQGIEDGDPEILDGLPSAPLSGEWADGLTPDDVIRAVESETEIEVSEEERDEILSAFEDGFSEGAQAEVVRSAQALVGEA